MAFWNKYKVELSDVYGLRWDIEVQEDSASGSTTYLTGTGNPLRIECLSDSDDYNETIRPSKAIFEVYSTSDFALTDFYTDQDFRLKVNIKYGSTLYWTGYVITAEYSEPYVDIPYPVTITAVDGLTYLKSIDYKDSGDYYDGRKRISKILLDILAKINITAFTEYINIYETEMNNSVDDSPLDQAYLDVDIFRDMSCYEVLQAVLQPFNAIIRQRLNGTIAVYRPEELTRATVYGRTFTGETTKSSTSYNPDQFISRTTKTDLKQLSGGAMMIRGALKKITLNQDYGYKESWLDNWQFPADTWDGSDTFEGWISSSGANAIPVSSVLGEGDSGVYLNSYDIVAPNGYYIRQEFGPYAVEDLGTQYALEFDYLVHNTTAADVASLSIAIQISTDSKYLNALVVEGSDYDGYAAWVAGVAVVEYQMTAKVGVSGWKHFKIEVPGCDGAGPLQCYLFSSNKANVYVAYKDVKFYNYSAEASRKLELLGYRFSPTVQKSFWGKRVVPTEVPVYGWVSYDKSRRIARKEYIANNETLHSVSFGKETVFNYIIGDVVNTDVDVENIVEQYAGAIGKPGYDYRVDTVTLTGGEAAASADITCDGETQACEFDTDLTTTAAKFVTDHAAQYASGDVTVTSSGADIIFTSDILGADFTGATTIISDLGTLDGTVTLTTPARPDDAISNTETWNTRGGSEDDPLLEIIAGEIGNQYSRPKQLIQMTIAETDATAPVLDIIGNLQDPLNTYLGGNRKFVFNAGEFDVKRRIWNADIIEMIYDSVEVDTVDYGFLYNFYVVDDARGIAASGWHIPSLNEFITLCTAAGGLSVAGATLREIGTTYWESDTDGATNAYKFNGRGAGSRRNYDALFQNLTQRLNLWTNEISAEDSNPYAVMMYTGNDAFDPITGNRNHAFSVRLLKDSTTLSDGEEGTYTGNDGKVYRTICIGTQEWLADNLAETKYRNGDLITEVTDGTAWAALTTEGYCAYDNDPNNV